MPGVPGPSLAFPGDLNFRPQITFFEWKLAKKMKINTKIKKKNENNEMCFVAGAEVNKSHKSQKNIETKTIGTDQGA